MCWLRDMGVLVLGGFEVEEGREEGIQRNGWLLFVVVHTYIS